MDTNNSTIEKHVTSIKENGFTIVDSVVPQQTLERLRSLTAEICEYADLGLEDPFQKYYLRHRADQGVLYDLFQRHPEFQEITKSKEILDILEHFVGPDIFLYENSLVYKPKDSDNAVPWHQDFINRADEPHKFIAWYALDDVRVANGAMQVIPGSHKNGFLPWHHVPGETHHTRLNLDGVDVETAVPVEVKAGSVLIFDQLLVHGSKKINSTEDRRAFRASYQGFDQVFTPRGTPIVLRGGSPNSLQNRYPNPHVEPVPEPQPEPTFINRVGNFSRRVKGKISRILSGSKNG